MNGTTPIKSGYVTASVYTNKSWQEPELPVTFSLFAPGFSAITQLTAVELDALVDMLTEARKSLEVTA